MQIDAFAHSSAFLLFLFNFFFCSSVTNLRIYICITYILCLAHYIHVYVCVCVCGLMATMADINDFYYLKRWYQNIVVIIVNWICIHVCMYVWTSMMNCRKIYGVYICTYVCTSTKSTIFQNKIKSFIMRSQKYHMNYKRS